MLVNSHIGESKQGNEFIPCSDISAVLNSQLFFNIIYIIYHQTSNIGHTKSQNLKVSSLALQLSLPNPLKPGVEN